MSHTLLAAISLLFLITDARAQSLIVHHPRIAIPNAANAPVVYPYGPSGPRLPPTSIQPAKPQAAPAGVTGCTAAGRQPAPIIAIVAALKCDPDLIFEYVHNNIEFEPLYGSNKGPLGTLLDRRGDDADQVILLVTLWNAAGYSQTGYVK